jgi:FAD binding domain
MTDIQIATTDGTSKILEEATVRAFRAGFRGPLLSPGDGAYDETRKVWNGMIDRRPALIARCSGVADVVAAVSFARAHGLLVSVRGGGHNTPGVAVCEGGLMIDLAGMKSVRVDPAGQTARAEGGTTWGDFDRESQLFGLATTGGAISHTGIGGLTLGGGLGWLAGKYGLACDNLLSVDLVTAEGRILKASADENAELFWGLRGGGGNFGIVTSFEYRLHAVGRLLAGPVLYPFAKAKEALALYRDFATSIPDELNTVAALMNSPDGDPLAAVVVCYNGSVEAGERVLRPLRTFGPPLADEVAPMPYCKVQTLFDEAFIRGRRYYFKSNFTRSISDAAIATRLSASRPRRRACRCCISSNWAIRRTGSVQPRRHSAIATRCASGAATRFGRTRCKTEPISAGPAKSRRRCAHSRAAATMSSTISASKQKRGRIASGRLSARIMIGSWL